MLAEKALADELCAGFYRLDGASAFSQGLVSMDPARASGPESFERHARELAAKQRGLDVGLSLLEQTRRHVGHDGWDVSCNPEFGALYLRAHGAALSRVPRGLALVSIVENPSPPKYPTLDLEGVLCFGWHQPGAGNDVLGSAQRRVFAEAGLVLPRSLFEQPLPADLPPKFESRGVFGGAAGRSAPRVLFLTVRVPAGARLKTVRVPARPPPERFGARPSHAHGAISCACEFCLLRLHQGGHNIISNIPSDSPDSSSATPLRST